MFKPCKTKLEDDSEGLGDLKRVCNSRWPPKLGIAPRSMNTPFVPSIRHLRMWSWCPTHGSYIYVLVLSEGKGRESSIYMSLGSRRNPGNIYIFKLSIPQVTFFYGLSSNDSPQNYPTPVCICTSWPLYPFHDSPTTPL